MAHEWLALHHALATAAGLLHPGDLDDLDLRRARHRPRTDGGRWLAVEQLADVLAVMPKACLWHDAQLTAAVGASVARVQFATLARRVLGDAGTSASGLLGRGLGLLVEYRPLIQGFVLFGRRVVGLGRGHPQILERQFELLDLAFDLLRAGTELLLLELRDPDPSRQRRAFSATPAPGDRGRAGSPTSSRFPPAEQRSCPSERWGHRAYRRVLATYPFIAGHAATRHKNKGFQCYKLPHAGRRGAPIQSAPVAFAGSLEPVAFARSVPEHRQLRRGQPRGAVPR